MTNYGNKNPLFSSDCYYLNGMPIELYNAIEAEFSDKKYKCKISRLDMAVLIYIVNGWVALATMSNDTDFGFKISSRELAAFIRSDHTTVHYALKKWVDLKILEKPKRSVYLPDHIRINKILSKWITKGKADNIKDRRIEL